jgi:hypothetical protein
MEALRKILDTAWKAWWDTASPAGAGAPFPLEYHNQPFTLPAAGPYGRLTLRTGETAPASVGSRHDRTPAILALQIFLPEGSDFAVATRMRDTVRDFWRYKQLSATDGSGIVNHVDCEAVSLTESGAEKGYKQFNVWLNFRCDELFPG